MTANLNTQVAGAISVPMGLTMIRLNASSGTFDLLTVDVRLANAAPASQATGTVRSDNFSDNNHEGWSTISGTNAPSWSASTGALVQANNVDATYAFWNDPAAMRWSNYTYKADLLTPTDDNIIAMLFGMQDSKNYYSFAMKRASGYRRLIKA